LERVAALVEEHEVVCRDQGFTEADARRDLSRGWLLVRQGRVREGIESLERGLRITDSLGTGLERSYHLTVLSDAYRRAGEFDRALRLMNDALAQSRATAETYYQAEMHRLRAEILWMRPEPGSFEEIDAELDQALRLSRAQNARGLELRAACTLVRWRTWCASSGHLMDDARVAQARVTLSTVWRGFREGADTQDLREAKALLEA
jgi:predicted ATPase